MIFTYIVYIIAVGRGKIKKKSELNIKKTQQDELVISTY